MTLRSAKGTFGHGRGGHACEACCLLGRDQRSFQALLVSARHRLVVVLLLLGHLHGLGLRPSRHNKNWLAPGPKQLASFPGRFSCHMSFRLSFLNVAMESFTASSQSLSKARWKESLHRKSWKGNQCSSSSGCDTLVKRTPGNQWHICHRVS